jgi:NAD-dependent SIR2 family protein deacetylase
MIMTGAGVSAASGIPTFRGDDGFWKKTYGAISDPTQILTTSFFKEHPEINWEWHYDFLQLAEKCKPNAAHHAVL